VVLLWWLLAMAGDIFQVITGLAAARFSNAMSMGSGRQSWARLSCGAKKHLRLQVSRDYIVTTFWSSGWYGCLEVELTAGCWIACDRCWNEGDDGGYAWRVYLDGCGAVERRLRILQGRTTMRWLLRESLAAIGVSTTVQLAGLFLDWPPSGVSHVSTCRALKTYSIAQCAGAARWSLTIMLVCCVY
jgi:hypothetical protein